MRLVTGLTLGLLFAVAPAAEARGFRAGAAVGDFTPPAHGKLAGDKADCGGDPLYSGPRPFSLTEPFADSNGNGVYDPGEPFDDCNGNERWEGPLIGGGDTSPRFATKVADPIEARALVVSNGKKTIAVEVLDNEGAFNVFLSRIRDRVQKDGFKLDGIFISSNHDESAIDTIGLGGVETGVSGVNEYFGDYMVDKSVKAIEDAYRAMRPARLVYAEAREPSNMRQCWSSYPFVDDDLMPIVRAVDMRGRGIATLASVSQHAETLGFNDNAEEKSWISADWIHFFRTSLERRLGGVGIEMAGSVGSVETPEIFAKALSQRPKRFIGESHPAGCDTLFAPRGKPMKTGYSAETKALGEQLAAKVAKTVKRTGRRSRSTAMWGARDDVCFTFTNTLFKAAGALGVFAVRPGYSDNCTTKTDPLPNGTTMGDEVLTQVAAFRIGDGEFISLPGEVFPFTYMRGFLRPEDLPNPDHPELPPWLFAHMHARYRFFDGLAQDMVGYVFPYGNGTGVPGESTTNQTGDDTTDRFGCDHRDDPESAGSGMGNALGEKVVKILDAHGKQEPIVRGRYVLADGRLSRDPQGPGPQLKCKQDTQFAKGRPARAVWLAGAKHGRVVRPAAWMSLSGRRQAKPTRDTRGWLDRRGRRHWLDVYPEMKAAPKRVSLKRPRS